MMRWHALALAAVVLIAGVAVSRAQPKQQVPPDDPSGRMGPVSVPRPAERAAGTAIRAPDAAALREEWGIRIEGLRLTALGYMLNFQYTVLDARKAAPLFVRRHKPILIDEATGAAFAVPVPPKTGALRSSNDPKVGKTYFMFFANPGGRLTRGQKATVKIDDFMVKGLTVR